MSAKPVYRAICVFRGQVYRIQRDEKPVALAIAYANGTWALTDLQEKKLSRVSYPSPGQVANAAERRNLGAPA